MTSRRAMAWTPLAIVAAGFAAACVASGLGLSLVLGVALAIVVGGAVYVAARWG